MTTANLTLYRRSELQAIDEGCLARYKAIWLDGIDDVSDPALIGIGFHKVKYLYIQLLLEAQTISDGELATRAFLEGVALAQTPSRLIPELKRLWDWHVETFELALERYVTAEEKQIAGAVVFTPDLVEASPDGQELEVHDDKSGWHPPLSEDELRHLFQARVYAYYAMRRWPHFARYRFTLHAVRFNKVVSVVFSHAELESIETELTAHIATIEQAKLTNEWPAVAGPACHFCELKCPLVDNNLVLPKRLLGVQQAQQAGAFLLAAEPMIRSVKKALKGYVAVHGAVDVHGIAFDNRSIVSKSYPADVVVKALAEAGAAGAFDDAADLGLTISHSALKKLFKRFPLLEETIGPSAIEKETWRFGAKQDDGED